MRSTLARAAVGAAALVVVAVVAFTIGRNRAAPTAAPSPATAVAAAGRPDSLTLPEQVREDAGLQVETAGRVERTDMIDATAVVALDETRTARIVSMVDGTVVTSRAEVGDRVKSGTLLAEMHSHMIHDAWADYRRAIAERRRLENELVFAKDAEARAERLLASKAVAQQERERAAANRVAAEEQLDMARTEVRRSEEALEHLGITSGEDPTGESGERIPVRTPMGGVVLERTVTPGTAVTTGTPMFVVSDLGALWALAEVDERHLGALAVGRAVRVEVSAFPDEPFAGTIAFIGDTVNEKTRRVVVRCLLPNPDGRLRPGMFANVRLATGAPREITAVRPGAVQEVEGRRIVFVETRPGTYAVRTVTVGAEADGWIEVTSGLQAGEKVVTTGSFLLKSRLLEAAMADEG